MIKHLRPVLHFFIAIGSVALASQGFAKAQTTYSSDDKIDAVSRAQVVNALADQMRDIYVFPDVGEKAEKSLKGKLKLGGYDSVTYASGLASVLTADMASICHDIHLRVDYGDLPTEEVDPGLAPPSHKAGIKKKSVEAVGSGLGKPEMLPGNIGYLEVREFMPAKYVKKAIADAMAQLTNNAALIIDLRRNYGGKPETVALISSYLFDKRTHLNDLQWRDGARTQQFWTDEKLSGRKFGQSKPVYVLTGGQTCSGAEEFSYDLQSLKRATVVGEVTCGGAHEGRFKRLNDRFYVFMPMARAINPVTKTNWEGKGVQPDVTVPEDTALLVAQKLAVQELSATEKNQQKRLVLRGRLSELDSQLLPPADAGRK